MPDQAGSAARAARTASRASLRDARATLCPSASNVLPDSERGNAPPMYSLYVFLTESLVMLAVWAARLRKGIRQ